MVCLLVGALGLALFAQQRIARCAAVPLFAENILLNSAFAPGDDPAMPQGYERAAGGVQLRGPAVDGQGFDLDGDGRAVQLIGIANYVQTPPVAVRPGASYCFAGYALSDTPSGSPTRLRVSFEWRDAADAALASDASAWQPAALWRPDAAGWGPIAASFRAPAGAASLRIRLSPASDDRVYIDGLAVRQGGTPNGKGEAFASPPAAQSGEPRANALPPQIAPWPDRTRAAVAFTFDWETTMGGLVHSRSVDDPSADQDPVARGLRMREGITTTIALFQPYGVRATYFATGYNFLNGNPERRRFMGDPTFAWANQANRWPSERWAATPWFADDPYGTLASDPAWYFGDLIAPLQAAGHEIQSHTFSHFYGGLVDAPTWQADLNEWKAVAAEQGVGPASALAFPWSSSGGMSDANWEMLEAAGITAVTRLSDQAQYNLFPADDQGLVREPHCQPLPGHAAILACPDFYLTEASAEQAIVLINRAVEQGGMIDLWAHTEEVVSPAQIAAWERVVRHAAENRQVWVAPFSAIAGWQQALGELRIVNGELRNEDQSMTTTIYNDGDRALAGLTLHIPPNTAQVALNGDILTAEAWAQSSLVLDLAAGRSAEIQLWPIQ